MTVATTVSKSGPYAGAGTVGPFTVGFRFLENEHLQVIRTSTIGIDTTLVLDTGYTVAGAGGSSGSVTLTAALAVGEKLTIIRNVPATQEADYVQNDAFPAESHERALDKLTMLVQQQGEALDRSLTLPATVVGVSTELPTPASNKLIGWNEAANGLQNVDQQLLATIVAFGSANADIFTGDGVTTIFALSSSPATLGNLDVAIGGVTQTPGIDYTWASGTTLTFTTAPVNGATVLARYQQGLPAPDTAIRAELASSSGASLVAHLPAGVGAVLRTADEIFDETVSVKDFGATGTGENATAAFAAAFATGKRVYAPAGTYLLDFLNVPSNTYLFGDGASTVIKPLTDDTRCALGADSGSAVAFIENITIRDVKFLGNVAGAGFGEQKHLTSFNGVKNMLIEGVHFIGFRGDGLYLGSGNGAGEERHNVSVTVRKCFFDGVNNDNRNGISIIDGDGVLIEDNSFIRCTRANMPAAIDIEPDGFAFHVVKNITVRENKFDTVRGGILFTNMDNLTEPVYGITIENNVVKGATVLGISVLFSFATTPLTQATRKMGVNVIGNRVEASATPFSLSGVAGANINRNTFVDCTGICTLGDGSFSRLYSFDIAFTENAIIRCGTTGGAGVSCDGITNLTLSDNNFTDCGDNVASVGCGVLFKPSFPGAVSNLTFKGNSFYKSALANMDAVRLTVSTISFSYENVHNNNFNGLTSIFLADSGTWTPSITFATQGDLAVTYAERVGLWRRDGKSMLLSYAISTAAFTYTTAAGTLGVSGFPAANGATETYSALDAYQGITLAGYTQFALKAQVASTAAITLASGSGLPITTVTVAHVPTGAAVSLYGRATYQLP